MLSLLALAGCPQPVETTAPPVTPEPVAHKNSSEIQDIVTDPEVAINHRDKFNWALFVEINRPLPRAGQGKASHVGWELWATDEETFPTAPDPDQPPAWPGEEVREKKLRPSTQLGILGNPNGASADQEQTINWYVLEDGKPVAVPVGKIEEVRRNKAGFDYIVDNDLYYQEGLAAMFKKAEEAMMAAANPPEGKAAPLNMVAREALIIGFPDDAVEIKANWVPLSAIPEAQRGDYYTNTGVDPATGESGTYALVAMHVASKRLLNWTWATWMNKNVLGRCDDIGCRDTFGHDPANTLPNAEANLPYPDDAPTPELMAWMKAEGLDAAWQNYRLVGSQTEWTDPQGVPMLLSNTITEQGALQTGSCITCHARAAVDRDGKPTSVTSAAAQGATPPPGDNTVTDNGPPQVSWFLETANDEPYTWSGTQVTGLKAMQVDFVWGFIGVQPAAKP